MKKEQEAQRHQQNSLGSLFLLISRSIQVLIFLRVLNEYKLLELLPPKIPQERVSKICALTFKEYAVEEEGVDVLKQIMKVNKFQMVSLD